VIGIGVLGLGSVFWGPYMSLIEKLQAAGRVHVAAVHDPDPDKRRAAAARLDTLSPLAVLGRGYAVCWNEDKTAIVRSAAAVNPGDAVRVTLAEGELACRVENRK